MGRSGLQAGAEVDSKGMLHIPACSLAANVWGPSAACAASHPVQALKALRCGLAGRLALAVAEHSCHFGLNVALARSPQSCVVCRLSSQGGCCT